MRVRIALAAALAVLCLPALAGDAATYGAAPTLEKTTSIVSILEKPEAFADKLVKVEGSVTEVCSHKGCWLRLEADGKAILAKSTGDKVVIPTDSAGKKAVVEGKVVVSHPAAGHEHASEGHECPDASVRLETHGVVLH